MLSLPFADSGNAAAFEQIIEAISRASLGLHVSGEKGLGKEAIVRLMYARSHYRGYPFIKVNCPVLSDPVASPDKPCIGRMASVPSNSSFSMFRLFHQGVLYLHGVDELCPELQRHLLTLIRRKAASADRPMSRKAARGMLILSTSTRPLDACVGTGSFDPNLCELLSGLSIHIPPLRRSPERIGPLVDYFMKISLREWRPDRAKPSTVHLARLRNHPWPGNLKELLRVVQRALRDNDWDDAIRSLSRSGNEAADYSTINLTPDGIALMPDFEINQGSLLESLSERYSKEEMGLMDLLIYEEVMANNIRH